jgi:uncharacterized protein YdeI (YjbR/CyaY-like superfamily)
VARSDDAEFFHAETREEWRAWLAEHHERDEGVWLVSWRTATGRSRVPYEEAVMEALAVGWIDGQAKTIDDERHSQWFSKRKPRSPWSAPNKERVERIEAEGYMQPAGRAAIKAAKANGMWSVFDDADRLIEPPELTALLDADPVTRENWNGFPPSVRRYALAQIALAQRAETRGRRIAEIAKKAAAGERPGPR